MNNKKTNLFLSPELAGAIGLHKLTDEKIMKFKNNPHDFLTEIDFDFEDSIKINAVENSQEEIHLTLPFYSDIENFSTDKIDDENMDTVSGGEIIVTLLVVGGVAGAIGGTIHFVSEKAKAQGRDATYKAITGEGDPNAGK